MELSNAVIWLIVFAALIIIELATMGLTTIWFAGGALVACAISGFTPVWVQILIFLVVSGVLLYFTRPIAIRYFNHNRTLTNVEEKIGKPGVVISEIDNIQGIGQVKISGMDWSARSYTGEPIKAGTVVRVKAVEGVKLIVEKEMES